MAAQHMAESVEECLLPHLDAAYNLARWLVRNKQDAEDVVQEAYLRALRFWGDFRGGDSRPWLLKIVRNTAYTLHHKKRLQELETSFDEGVHSEEASSSSPETLALRSADKRSVRKALEELPMKFREVLVLRELEGLSYKEIAAATGTPVGTVMSGLSRARVMLRQSLTRPIDQHRSVSLDVVPTEAK
jgi:RNA polymerase sigma factor (sigma-70 family)